MKKKKYTDEERLAELRQIRYWTLLNRKELDKAPVSEADRLRKEQVRQNLAAGADLVRELNDAGVPVFDIGELVSLRLLYPKAIPVLLRHVGLTPIPLRRGAG